MLLLEGYPGQWNPKGGGVALAMQMMDPPTRRIKYIIIILSKRGQLQGNLPPVP